MSLFAQIQYLIIYLVVVDSKHFLEHFAENPAEQKLKKYLKNLHLDHDYTNNLFTYLNTSADNCSSLSNWYIGRQEQTMSELDNGKIAYAARNLGQTDAIFVFIIRIEDITMIFQNSEHNRFFCKRVPIIFIACTSYLGSFSSVKIILKTVWNNQIFNFVVIYVHEGVKVFSYNKFKRKKVLNFTSISSKYSGNVQKALLYMANECHRIARLQQI